METNKNISSLINSNEYKLLFLCSVNEPSPEIKNEIDLLMTETIDWDMFLKILLKHRIYPLVYHNLKKLNKTDLDVPIIDNLEKFCKKNTMHSLRLSSGLIEVIALLESNNVRAISLKGPILSMELFGNIALRTSKDLDILVDFADSDKVFDLFYENGFKNDHFDGDLTDNYKKFLIKTHHHISFSKKDLSVEIHWKYHKTSFNCAFNDLWAKSEIVKLSNKDIHILSKEDEFLYLVFHGAKHGWFRLKWLSDVSEIIKRDHLIWSMVIEKAVKYDILHVLVQALILTNRLYSVKSSIKVLEQIKNKELGLKLADLATPLIYNSDNHSYDLKKYTYTFSQGWKLKLSFILNHFSPTGHDFKEFGFRDQYFFMFYIISPFYKIWRVIQKVLHR